jgi:hypothetical protein
MLPGSIGTTAKTKMRTRPVTLAALGLEEAAWLERFEASLRENGPSARTETTGSNLQKMCGGTVLAQNPLPDCDGWAWG